MKRITGKTVPVFIILSVFLLYSCVKKDVPSVTTAEVIDITGSSATCGGTVTDEGFSILITRGVCWDLEKNPTVEDEITNNGFGLGTFTSKITGLKGSTTYHVRAYATNKNGTGYGDEVSFRTPPGEIVFNNLLTYGNLTDQDGNMYRTIQIGQQTWMAENMRAIHYQDGSPVQNLTDHNLWVSATTGAYCYYENDTINRKVFGALYNWYAAADQRNLCPAGWHVPSDEEWVILDDFLRGDYPGGMKMRETSLTHWAPPNLGATNESGFTGLPAGTRNWEHQGDFNDLGTYGVFWTSTEYSSQNERAWFYDLYTNSVSMGGGIYYKPTGFSVRCVKD